VARDWRIPGEAAARYSVLTAAVVAGLLLDGPATGVRPEVPGVVPRWLLHAFSQNGEIETLALVILVLLVHGLITRQAASTRGAMIVATALVVTAIVVVPLKWLASRGGDGVFYLLGRGGDEGITFPSGHAALPFAACTVFAAAWRESRAGSPRAPRFLSHPIWQTWSGSLASGVPSRNVNPVFAKAQSAVPRKGLPIC
jgi:membrane-associated phospholipid phosphatase